MKEVRPGIDLDTLRALVACERDSVAEAEACSQALLDRREDASRAEAPAPKCKDLADRLLGEARAIPSTSKTLALLPSESNGAVSLRAILVEQRRRYKYLTRWIRKWTNPAPPAEGQNAQDSRSAQDELEALRNKLYDVLEKEGLREDFSAELVQGFMLQNSASEPGGGSDDTQPTYLRIRSRRFGRGYGGDHTLEGMLTVRLGLVPTLLLVEPAPTPTPAPGGPPSGASPAATPSSAPSAAAPAGSDAQPATTHEKAPMFDLRLDGIVTFGSSSELLVGASYGQTVLGSKSLIRKVGGRDTLFTTLGSGPGTWAEYWTAGIGYRYFHRSARDVKAEQPSLEPLLEAFVDFRHDARFKLDSEVAGRVGLDRPERRLVFGFKLGGIPLIDRRNPTTQAASIGLGIEHERGFSSRGAPPATRIFLTGDLSVLKAFAGK